MKSGQKRKKSIRRSLQKNHNNIFIVLITCFSMPITLDAGEYFPPEVLPEEQQGRLASIIGETRRRNEADIERRRRERIYAEINSTGGPFY